MKKIQFLFIGCFICLILIGHPAPGIAQNEKRGEKNSFVVVELFTSEGCSSCPPADQFLIQLTSLAQKTKKNIITLGFHVDYWNYLGWKDRFSNQQFSRRQRLYAQKLRLKTIYTPQMIINGTKAFGGYHKDLITKEIDAALQAPQKASIAVQVRNHAYPDHIELEFQTLHVPEVSQLNFCLVERELSSDVTSGENHGRKLTHANVVRSFQAIPADVAGRIKIDKPEVLKLKNSSVIIYIQNPQNMQILGAAIVNLIDSKT